MIAATSRVLCRGMHAARYQPITRCSPAQPLAGSSPDKGIGPSSQPVHAGQAAGFNHPHLQQPLWQLQGIERKDGSGRPLGQTFPRQMSVTAVWSSKCEPGSRAAANEGGSCLPGWARQTAVPPAAGG